jgi:hypothetical protein
VLCTQKPLRGFIDRRSLINCGEFGTILFSVCGWTRIEKGRVHEKYVDELYKYDQSSEIDTQAEEGK